jgi:hypothetical protein
VPAKKVVFTSEDIRGRHGGQDKKGNSDVIVEDCVVHFVSSPLLLCMLAVS